MAIVIAIVGIFICSNPFPSKFTIGRLFNPGKPYYEAIIYIGGKDHEEIEEALRSMVFSIKYSNRIRSDGIVYADCKNATIEYK